MIKLVFPELNEIFINTRTQWFIGQMSASVSSAFQTAAAGVRAGEGETLQGGYIGYSHTASNDSEGTAIALASHDGATQWWAIYRVDFSAVAGTTDRVDFSFSHNALNGDYYGSYFRPLVDLIVSRAPYHLQADNKKQPSVFTLTSEADPNFWFEAEL